MTSENPLNPPTSRDPRLTHLRPPVRPLASLPAPQLPNSPIPPQPAAQVDAGYEDFIRGISGLVRATIQENQHKAEQERLQKQKESTERLLKRAKAYPNFPATIDFYQRARDAEDAEISRIDKALEQSIRRQLEKELKTKFPASTSAADGKIQELENQMNLAKTEVSRLMERNKSLEAMLNTKLSKLETTFQSQSTAQTNQNKELKDRLDGFQALSSHAETKSAVLKSELNDIVQKNKTLNTRVEQLWKSQNHCTASVAKNTEQAKEQQEKLDNMKLQDIESIRKAQYELKTRLISFENTHVSTKHAEQHISPAELQKLTSRVQTLEGAPSLVPKVKQLEECLNDLQKIHQMSDDLNLGAKEKLEEELGKHVKKSTMMSNEITRLSNKVQALSQLNSTPTAQQFASLLRAVEQTNKVLESFKVALHSLETRYNSLSTETVVKNMVVAMQEMYPNVSQLTDQTNKLKGMIEKDVTPLISKVDDMDRALQTHISTARQDATVRLDELNRLRHDHSCLSQSLGPLWERFSSQGQLVSSEEFRALQADFNSLVDRVAKYPPEDQLATFGDLEVLQSKFNVLDQVMSGFRTSFTTQLGAFSSMSAHIRELSASLAELKAASTSSRDKLNEKLTSQEGNIVSVQNDVGKLQADILDKYQHMCKELETLQTSLQPPAPEPSTTVSAREDPAPSLDDQIRTPKEEAPAPELAEARVSAETSPALALREQKKKKRPRPSGLANEEKVPGPPSESPESLSSPGPSTPRANETPESKKKRRRKKRKIDETRTTSASGDRETILIPDD